jgi:hypothetical protein
MKAINILFLLTVMCFAIGASAQDPLSKDVRVVREFDPTVSDAMKINQMPEREDTLAAKPEFNYQVTGHAVVSTPEIETLSAAKLARQREGHLFPSYVRGGLGNYQLLFGEVFYNITHNEEFAFALKLGQHSSWGDLELKNDEIVEAPYHETDGGVYLRHFFDNKTLEFDLNFDRFGYRYYGFQTINSEMGYGFDEEVSGQNLIPDDKQHQTGFDLHFGLLGQQSDLKKNRYHLFFDYGAFNNYTGMGENSFSLLGDFKMPFGEIALHLNGGARYYDVNVPSGDNKMPDLWTFDGREQIFFFLDPRLVIPGGALSVEIGVNATAELAKTEELYLSPHVEADLVIAEGIVSSFVGMTGEVRPASYRSVMAENPYLSPDELVKTAFSNIRGFGGVKGNFSSATSFTARLDYEFIENEHFFENRVFPLFDDNQTYGMSNLFRVVYSDATLLTVSGELLVRPNSSLDVLLKGAYYGWELDAYEHAWHKPEMEIGLRAGYTIDEEWRVDGALNLLGERYARDINQPDGVEKLDAVTDFNMGVNYQHNKRLHFFGRFQNIFASKYYRWSGYPLQGFNFRVGAGYSF